MSVNQSYLDSAKKARTFMFGDIDTMVRKKTGNFVVALALNCYTEYWGQFLVGDRESFGKGYNGESYNRFFRRLGTRYDGLLNSGLKVYREVRCGLAHSYLIAGNATISIDGGNYGVEYDSASKGWHFYGACYLRDLKQAVDTYLSGLESDKESASAFNAAMKDKPILH